MSYTIRLTPSDIRRRADSIQQNAEKVRQEVSKVEQLLNSLKPTFLGQRAEKFFREFDRERSNMQQWDDIVRSFAEELRNTAARMDRADRA